MFNYEAIILGVILGITLLYTKFNNCYLFESKFLSYLAYISFFIVSYKILIKKDKNIILENYTDTDKKVNFEGFIPTETFAGRKSGYVFKTGNEGTGYYLDS